MAQLLTASIDVTKIDKNKLIVGKKGTYCNLTIWIDDTPNQFGNDVSVQQSLSKEEREAGVAKIFLGNGKSHKGSNAAAQKNAAETEGEDLPF